MTTTEFLSVASQIKVYASWVSPLIALFVSYFYIYTRTGSAGFIHDLVWRIAGGRAQFHNKTLQAEQTRIVDYERFKYKTGIRFTSYNNITDTRAWLREHNVGIEELMQVRKYFNCSDVSLREPNLKKVNNREQLALTFFAAGALVFLLMGMPAALLTVKKTSTMFWATETSVRSWNVFGWKINKEDCPNPEVNLKEHDLTALCEIFTDKGSKEFLREAMFNQKLLGFGTLGLSAILLFYALALGRQAAHAANLYERIYKETPTGEPGSTLAAGSVEEEVPNAPKGAPEVARQPVSASIASQAKHSRPTERTG